VASPRQVRVIRLGLDLAPFQALDPPPVGGQCLTVGWLGRLVEVKDVPLLIRVIGETLRRNPQIRFVVAGDGTQRPLMESAARRWPDGRVQWLGWQEDAAAVIAQCDVLVQTSRSEGTPIALIQGMAAGRPFVSTPAGGVVDMVVGDSIRESAGARWFSNAVLVEPDPAAFASALSELQGNRELVRAMGCQAAAFANARHNLAAIVRDYDRLYSELLASLSTRAWDAVPPAVDEIAENLTPQLGQKGS
jgi:glycosyltransferase involved in cell wall biosynthesis